MGGYSLLSLPSILPSPSLLRIWGHLDRPVRKVQGLQSWLTIMTGSNSRTRMITVPLLVEQHGRLSVGTVLSGGFVEG